MARYREWDIWYLNIKKEWELAGSEEGRHPELSDIYKKVPSDALITVEIYEMEGFGGHEYEKTISHKILNNSVAEEEAERLVRKRFGSSRG